MLGSLGSSLFSFASTRLSKRRRRRRRSLLRWFHLLRLRHISLIRRGCNFFLLEDNRPFSVTLRLTDCLWCSIVDEGFCVSFLGVGLLDILAGHNTCCLGSYVSGRWTLLSRWYLGQRRVHPFLGSLLSLSNGFTCVHSFFFSTLFPNCIQLVVSFSVESKLMLKFNKYGIW